MGPDTLAAQIDVEHIEGTTDQSIYDITSGQISYPVHTFGETPVIYAAASCQHYNESANVISQVSSGLSVGTSADQLLAQGPRGSDAYLTQQDVDPVTAYTVNAAQRANPSTATGDATANPSPDGSGHSNFPHIIRISPATVHWLMQNYEVAEGASLPRSTLYSHYLRHCKGNKLHHVNVSSFGKIIRSAFHGVRARKLGTKGNSKYYFYGIRVIPGSLNQLSRNGTSAVHKQPSPKKRYKFLPGRGGSKNGNQTIENQYKQNTNHSAISNHCNS
jgi:hypothetical protein